MNLVAVGIYITISSVSAAKILIKSHACLPLPLFKDKAEKMDFPGIILFQPTGLMHASLLPALRKRDTFGTPYLQSM